MHLRITTWNINSVRLRPAALAKVVRQLEPDVLCLQETKVADEAFPRSMVEDLGFEHLHIHGQKAYHGVAILSRRPLEGCHTHRWCAIDDSRHAVCTLQGGIELHNVYVPAGGDEPDIEKNPKFRHKLAMLDEMSDWFAASRDDTRRIVLVGDLNIAPLENDVWSHKQLLKVVSHTPVEVAKLERLRQSHGFVDAVRAIVPPEEKLYTWWSYRARDWRAADRGRRLDHVWLSPALAPALRDATVMREARGFDLPSDHVPVTVDLDV